MSKRRHTIIADRYVVRSLLRVRGQWASDIRDRETGRVRRKFARASKEADAWAEIIRWVEGVVAYQGTPAPVELGAVYQAFCEQQTCRASTARFYEITWRRIGAAFGRRLVADIRPGDVDAYMAHRLRAGKSPRTVAMEVGLLRQLYRLAMRREWSTRDPTAGIRLGASRRDVGQALDTEGARALVGACKAPYLRLAVLMALYTGLRHRNVLGATWRHLDLDSGVVAFGAEETKGGRALRLPLHPVLVRELRHTAARRQPLALDDRVIGPTRSLERSWRTALSRSGIQPIRWHDLRHTYASWISRHATYAVLQALLGHAPQTVTGLYAHATWTDMVAAVRALPDLSQAETLAPKKNLGIGP